MRVLLLNRVENIVTKGEQFLLILQCFQKSAAAETSKCFYKWMRVKSLKPKAIGEVSSVSSDAGCQLRGYELMTFYNSYSDENYSSSTWHHTEINSSR